MVVALEGGYDLAALALCFLALAALLATRSVIGSFLHALDFSIFGYQPLHGLVTAAENAVIAALDDAIKGVEALAARFESGLIDAFGLLIALPILLGLGVKAALSYLWSSALRPVIHSITDTIKATAARALSLVEALEATVAANLLAAESYARERAAGALSAAEGYVDRRVDGAIATLRGVVRAAVSEAEAFAEQAVGRLRSAEDVAIANAVGLAAEAKAAGLAAAAAALRTAEGEVSREVAQARADAAAALATVDAAGKAALAGVRAIAVTAEDELVDIEGAFGALGVGALIASIPALATLVHAIAAEAGLENAECRTKVKGICGTNPAAWGNLLAGIALIGVTTNLGELVQVAKAVIADGQAVMKEFA